MKVMHQVADLCESDRQYENSEENVSYDGSGASQALPRALADEVKEASFDDGGAASKAPHCAHWETLYRDPGRSAMQHSEEDHQPGQYGIYLFHV